MPALVAVLAAIGALIVLPHQQHLAAGITGDARLAARTAAAAGGPGRIGLAVAVVDGQGVRGAGLGTADGAPADQRTRFATASVAKTFTGMLLADAVRRGELTPGTTLGEIYGPRVRGGLRAVTVAELGSHRSGLPSVPVGWWRQALAAVGGSAFPAASGAEVLRAAQRAPLGPRGGYAYSNLGMALLGDALAYRAHTTFPALLHERLLAPLGMRDTGLLPGVRGHDQLGRPVAAAAPGGYAPAGPGMYSSAADLARLLDAVLRGTAPGLAATAPRYAAGGTDRTGFDWVTSRIAGRPLLWHAGGDAGTGTFIGISGGRGVVLMGNTGRDVSAAGMRLLGLVPPAALAPADPPAAGGRWLVVELLVLASAVLVPLWTLRRGRDRVGVLVAALGGLAALALGWALVPWAATWTWVLWALAVTGVGAVAGGGLVRPVPWCASGLRASRHVVLAGMSAAVLLFSSASLY